MIRFTQFLEGDVTSISAFRQKQQSQQQEDTHQTLDDLQHQVARTIDVLKQNFKMPHEQAEQVVMRRLEEIVDAYNM